MTDDLDRTVSMEIDRRRPPGALYAKSAATVVKRRPAAPARRPERERMTAPYVRRYTLLEEAKRRERAGKVRLLQAQPVWSHERNQWEILVERLVPVAPRWRKPVVVAGSILATLGALFGLGWWALSTLAAIPGALAIGAAAVLFFLWVLIGGRRAGARGVTEVFVSVMVRTR